MLAVRIRVQPWRALVPITAVLAGVILATSAITAHGTELRASPLRLQDLVTQQSRTLERQSAEERALRASVAGQTGAIARSEAPVARARSRADAIAGPAGLTPLTGPAVTVTLADAPRPATRGTAPAPNPDDLVVHQQDVQGVVNALWAGGAEAMTIMGKRVVSTTAVRCVGNTLLLHGAVYSPPFTITALGAPARLVAALDADASVSIFRQYVAVYGLGYRVTRAPRRTVPTYDGPLGLRHAHA